MSKRSRPSLGTLERLPKAARMWEAVYRSAQERGFSEERSAQQAWGAVKRAGYWEDDKAVWHAPKAANPRRQNADPEDPDYHRRNLIVDRDLVTRAMEWHGGQSSMLYSFGSTAMDGYVSPAMIDAAVGELEQARESATDPAMKKEVDDLIGELDAVARFSSEHTTREYGVGDVDEGYSTWLMENPAPKNITGPLRIETKRDGIWVVGRGMAIPVESRAEAKMVKAQLARQRNPASVTEVRFDNIEDLADGLKAMDVSVRPTRHQRPVVFRVDWPKKTVFLEGDPDDPSVDAALQALDYAKLRFRSGVVPYAANPDRGRGEAAGYAFVGNLLGSLLGFGFGALIGAGAGALAGGGVGAVAGGGLLGALGSYAGGIVGSATGAARGAPRGQERDAKWGAGLGAAVPYVGIFLAPLGAYLATEDSRKKR